jgi:hypothetical protein
VKFDSEEEGKGKVEEAEREETGGGKNRGADSHCE